MDPKELKNMRLKQVAFLNGLLVMLMIFYLLITNVFDISFSHFFLVLGVLVLFQGIFGLIKGDSTKSIIPIFEKIAIYEKQKMVNEWYKQRKVSYFWNFVLSLMLFMQSYINWGYPERVFEIDPMFMIILTLLFFILLNISLFTHIRKVDGATSVLDFKGYTWKSNVIAIVIGIVFAFLIIFITFFYIMSTI